MSLWSICIISSAHKLNFPMRCAPRSLCRYVSGNWRRFLSWGGNESKCTDILNLVKSNINQCCYIVHLTRFLKRAAIKNNSLELLEKSILKFLKVSEKYKKCNMLICNFCNMSLKIKIEYWIRCRMVYNSASERRNVNL